MPEIFKMRVWEMAFYSGLAIWLSWIVVSLFFGGDAFEGKETGQAFFLGSHGRYTEVSRSVFTFSRIYGYVAWVSLGLSFLVGIFGYFSRKSDKKDVPPVA